MIKLILAAIKIKITRKDINPTILKLECQVKIVAGQMSYLFAKCTDQAIYINALMIGNSILLL